MAAHVWLPKYIIGTTIIDYLYLFKRVRGGGTWSQIKLSLKTTSWSYLKQRGWHFRPEFLKYKVVFPLKYQKLRQIYHRAERLITLSQGSYNMSQNPSKFSKALQFGARLERYISNIALLDLWLAAIGNICIERKVNKPKKTSVLREAFKNYLADFFR